MKRFTKIIFAGWVVLAMAGCATTPSTGVKGPLTARPEQNSMPPHNGAIFQTGVGRPLFEDHRARNVGDVLTINIVESTSTSASASDSASHAGSSNSSTPNITTGVSTPGGTSSTTTLLAPLNVSTSSTGALTDQSANAGANNFTGTITVTVTEVLPNGDLVVGGEKQVAVGKANEYIRFTGVVDPVTLNGNTVQSTQVSDVHLEYKGSDGVDGAQMMTMLGRFFLSILPF